MKNLYFCSLIFSFNILFAYEEFYIEIREYAM